MKYTIITDSSGDLHAKYYVGEKYEFVCVPLNITVGENTYVDDENFDTANLMAEMKSTKNAGKTSAPSPEAFADEMRGRDNIICVTLSSKISGTFNSARLAAESVLAEQPDKKIFVLDSLSASAGLGIVVAKIIDLIEGGFDGGFDALTQESVQIRDNAKIRFMLQDFSTLVKSGRMSKIVGLIAATLIVRPICGNDGAGEIKMFSKTIGSKKALNALSRFAAEKIEQEGTDFPILITHNHNEPDANALKALLENLGMTNIIVRPMRGIASVYAGEKGISMAY